MESFSCLHFAKSCSER